MSVATALRLPRASGAIEAYTPGAPSPSGRPPARRGAAWRSPPPTSSPTRSPPATPAGPAQLDWEATLAFRRHLWEHGFAVAEAMDTAQRGMGLDWAVSRELIRRSRRRGAGRGRDDRRAARAPTS